MRADAEAIERNELCSFIDAALQIVKRLQHWRLGADEAKHDALCFRHKTQRFEIAGPRGVIFEQEVGGIDPVKKRSDGSPPPPSGCARLTANCSSSGPIKI